MSKKQLIINSILILHIFLLLFSCSDHHRFDQIKSFETDKDEDALIDTLNNDKNNYIRTQAAQSLGRLKSKKAVPSLIKGLKHNDWAVRYYCADALGKIKDSSAVGPLKAQAAVEKDENVLRIINKALKKLGSK